MMRLILAGGGTGGHLFPGLAVAREFQKRDGRTKILFVGSEKGIEARVLPREGFPLEVLPVRGIKGRGLKGLLGALYGVPVGFFRSLGIIRRFRPQYVIGLGGYASGPLLLAAIMKRIRCAIMEQNVHPGLTNRILGWMVQRVFTSYGESRPFFSGSKVVETGNPIRWQVLPQVERDDKLNLFVFGGSAGAHRINMCIVGALERLKDLAADLSVAHQTGEADLASVQAAYASLPFESKVLPFIENIDEAYARADLIVCRAGASTLAEITAFGKAAVLIPYPYAANNHQRWNAQSLSERGAAEMLLEEDATGEKMAALIRTLFKDRKRLEGLGKEAARLGRPDAAKRIVDECYKIVGRGS